MNSTAIAKALNSHIGHDFNGMKLVTANFVQKTCNEEDDMIELTLKEQATGELREFMLILGDDEIHALDNDSCSQVFCHGSSTANRLVAQILNTLTRE